MGKGGEIVLMKKWGEGGEGSARDSAPSGACSPIKFLNFMHFQTHLWLSNDMMR